MYDLQPYLYDVEVNSACIKFIEGGVVVIAVDWEDARFTTISSADYKEIPFSKEYETKGLVLHRRNKKYYILKYIENYSRLMDVIEHRSSICKVW
jgi:hypothetical protein